MGVRTRVYKIDNDLAINIPSKVLPPSRIQIVEERIEKPGYLAKTTMANYPLIVLPSLPYRTKNSRYYMILTSDPGTRPEVALSQLGLDPTKNVYIRLLNTRLWLKAHKYHRGYYGRVSIPREYTPLLKNQTIYPVQIMGTTYPTAEIRYVKRKVKTVVVTHMNKTYPTENYTPNHWRWRIPKETESYPVLLTALSMNIYPEAECHLGAKEDVLVDFVFSSAAALVLAEKTGYAYRNMAVRNYTATQELDYPFLCEIRATYISCTPKMFYQPTEEYIENLKEGLKRTIYNILVYFFDRIVDKETGRELKYSKMSWADHIDAIDYVTNTVYLKRQYPQIKTDAKWKDKYMSYEAEGEGLPNEAAEQPDTKKYYYCIKYVRVLTESSYHDGGLDRWVYTNNEIENIIRGKQHQRTVRGLKQEVDIDINGFIYKIL